MIKYNTELTKADCKFPMSNDESRRVQLDMLAALIEYCNENGLRYFLSGGTLLGAIRHKGFIPWDDDIDVNMPRPDCEKLFQLTGGILGKYRLAGPDNGEHMDCCNWYRLYNDNTVVETFRGGVSKNHPYYYPIFIDIFPIEGLPSGTVKCYFHWARIFLDSRMRRASSLDHMEAKSIWGHIFHVISGIPAKIVGYQNWGKAIQKCSTKYSFDDATYVGVTTTIVHLTKEKVLKKDYLKSVKVVFEGKEYNAPGNYDTYLRQLYGANYNEMPPIEKQKSHHVFNLYWRNRQQPLLHNEENE